MSTPIDLQLREYSKFFDAQLAEVTVDEIITERVTPGPVRPLRVGRSGIGSGPPGPTWYRRPQLAFIAAAAVVLAVIVPVALMRDSGSDVGDTPEAATTLASQVVEPTPTAAPAPPTATAPATLPTEPSVAPGPPVDGLVWSAVPLNPEIFGNGSAWIGDVTATSEGFVAVGRLWPSSDLGPTAGVWLSPDGRDWVRVIDDEVMESREMVTVAASGLNVVAGGTELVELGSDWVENRHAIWWSGDGGLSWDRGTAIDDSFGAGGIQAVVATPDGLAAAGYTCVGEVEGELLAAGSLGNCDVQTRTVWKAVGEGENWTMAWQSEPVDFGAGVWSLVDTGTGLMIGGWAPTLSGSGAATLWVEDGTGVFEARLVDDVPLGTDNTSLVVMDVVVGHDRSLVAVGWESETIRLPGIWRSQDGITWSRAETNGDSTGIRLWGVTAADTGYVAVGTHIGADDQARAVAFTSEDGFTWNQQQVAPLGDLEAVAANGGIIVSVGSEPGSGAAIWVSTQTP